MKWSDGRFCDDTNVTISSPLAVIYDIPDIFGLRLSLLSYVSSSVLASEGFRIQLAFLGHVTTTTGPRPLQLLRFGLLTLVSTAISHTPITASRISFEEGSSLALLFHHQALFSHRISISHESLSLPLNNHSHWILYKNPKILNIVMCQQYVFTTVIISQFLLCPAANHIFCIFMHLTHDVKNVDTVVTLCWRCHSKIVTILQSRMNAKNDKIWASGRAGKAVDPSFAFFVLAHYIFGIQWLYWFTTFISERVLCLAAHLILWIFYRPPIMRTECTLCRHISFGECRKKFTEPDLIYSLSDNTFEKSKKIARF